jgi:PAS domain S-box-containing protein
LHSLRQSLREAQTSSKVANEANQKLAVGIEEREMLTTTLMRTQEKIRTIVDSITDAVVVADTSGTIIETNPAVVEVFGYTQQELQGQNISLLIPTEQATAHHRAFQHYLSSGNPHIIGKRQHLQAQHKDGHIIPIEITINEARVADNIIFTSIARDISQRLAIKTALIKARDEALTATRLKSEFLANVSHEIRTPMNGIMGMTHLLLDTPLDQEQRDLATTVLHSGEHLLYVINDILDLSRIEAGKFNIYKSSFNLLQMIQGIFGLLGESAHQKGLELSFFIDSSDLGDLASDSVRLRQILINLLSNAIKFTEKGSVVLKVHIAEIKAHSMLIRFDVHDTGCGIDAESIPKLFLAFSQLDGSSTRSHGGTGLGLAISKQLAQLLGGEMGVESIPGVGSCFWFTAEVQTSRQMNQTPDQTTTAPPIVPTTQTVTDTFLHRNLRILLVEDSLVNQKVALAMLKRLGYQQTDCAANGAAALRQVQEQDYDLVLMDCQMPIMDGYEATRSIRALDDEKFRELPIIALTAHAMQGDDGKCYAAGMDDYLTKPITPVTLQSHINQWAQAKLHHQLVEV